MSDVIVIIPIYKRELDSFELYSLEMTLFSLVRRKICFIGPHDLDKTYYSERFPAIPFIAFDKTYFESIEGYNRLLLSQDFYAFFDDHEFMLIAQTDAIVIRDDLDYWCAQAFDYVGAPWPNGFELFVNAGAFEGSNGKQIKVPVGNGGLNLRRIEKSIRLLKEFSGDILNVFLRTGSSEDLFFSVMGALSTDFVIANEITASLFSLEQTPSRYLAWNGGRLPMGGHAWWKYEPQFWLDILRKMHDDYEVAPASPDSPTFPARPSFVPR